MNIIKEIEAEQISEVVKKRSIRDIILLDRWQTKFKYLTKSIIHLYNEINMRRIVALELRTAMRHRCP